MLYTCILSVCSFRIMRPKHEDHCYRFEGPAMLAPAMHGVGEGLVSLHTPSPCKCSILTWASLEGQQICKWSPVPPWSFPMHASRPDLAVIL